MKKILSYTFFILLAIVLITLALSNPQQATLTVLPAWLLGGWTIELPMFVIIYLALFSGIAIGLFIEYIREARYRRQARRAKRALKKTEKKLEKTQKGTGENQDEVLAIVEA